jgi:hypothetical protein
MDDILNYIGAYKKLHGEYPKHVVSPVHAGKILYIMGDDMLPIREYPVNFGTLFTPPSAAASTTPPLEIPILAEEPK